MIEFNQELRPETYTDFIKKQYSQNSQWQQHKEKKRAFILGNNNETFLMTLFLLNIFDKIHGYTKMYYLLTIFSSLQVSL